MTTEQIKELLETELQNLELANANLARNALVEPFSRMLFWEYGDDEDFLVWFCFKFGHLYVVYCDHGHGPESPWGVVVHDTDALGPDSLWHSSLRLALDMAIKATTS